MNSQYGNQTIFCQIVFREINEDELSILIETDSKYNFYTYSACIYRKKLLDQNKNQINLEDCFKNKKISITKMDDKELFLELTESNKIIKFKRNMFYILWRDSNYIKITKNNKENPYYYDLKCWEEFCFNNNIFAHFVSSTEDALKFLKNRISNNIMFVTNIAKNLPGKRYVEIIRKIYGFDIIVLFFSSENKEHYKWIKDFPNCLYEFDKNIIKDYILKYNKEDLKKLRKKNMKKIAGLKLKEFSDDFFDYSKIENKLKVPNTKYKIYCETIDKYVHMNGEGNIEFVNDNDDCSWDIIFLDNTVTFYSKGFYLKDEDGNIKGDIYTFVWNYEKINDLYHFINPYNNKILFIDNNKLNTCNSNHSENINFQLISLEFNRIIPDYLRESVSDLSNKINNISDSKSLNCSKNDPFSNNEF